MISYIILVYLYIDFFNTLCSDMRYTLLNRSVYISLVKDPRSLGKGSKEKGEKKSLRKKVTSLFNV